MQENVTNHSPTLVLNWEDSPGCPLASPSLEGRRAASRRTSLYPRRANFMHTYPGVGNSPDLTHCGNIMTRRVVSDARRKEPAMTAAGRRLRRAATGARRGRARPREKRHADTGCP